MPVDIQALINLIKMLHLKSDSNLENQSHEVIINHALYAKGVQDVLRTLEGIDNGTIDTKEYLKNL